jgi:hypothetical protein
MRLAAIICGFTLLAAQSGFAQTDFSGSWKLNTERSDIRAMPVAPAGFVKVEQSANSLTVTMSEREGAPSTVGVLSLTYGKREKSRVGEYAWNSGTKWEGAALLVNILVTGPQDYSQDERWERSRDGRRLTIERTIGRRGVEVESVLVYEDPNAAVLTTREPDPAPLVTEKRPASIDTHKDTSETYTDASPRDAAPRETQPSREYVVTTGTRILTRLTNSVDTKRTVTGDKLYLQTAAPIFIDRQLVIPAGSYITAVVTEAERAGRVKGKSALNLRFESLTLPNGVSRDFRSRAGSVDTKGNLDRTEGRISGESNKGKDAATVAKTTAAGTGVGAIVGAAAGHVGMGAGIGAAAGALGGLAGVLGSRGADVVLPAGTTMEMVLDRDLRYSPEELAGRMR